MEYRKENLLYYDLYKWSICNQGCLEVHVLDKSNKEKS